MKTILRGTLAAAFAAVSLCSAQTCTFFGDSITAGSDASSVNAQYVTLLANKLGCKPNNQGLGGAQAADESGRIYAIAVPDSGVTYTYMIGTNDNWGYGTDPNGLALYQAIDLADLVYLAIPESQKIRASDWRARYNGYGWWQGPLYGNNVSAYCGWPGSSVSISLTGSVLYLSMGMQDGNRGRYSISVDGQTIGTHPAFGGTPDSPENIQTKVYGTTVAPKLIRIPVAYGTHEVKITVLDAYIFFDWAAANGNIGTNAPRVIAAGPPQQKTSDGKGGYPASQLAAYANAVRANAALLAIDGLNVRYADTYNAFTVMTDQAITNGYDDVHPNDWGHQLLYQTFVKALQ